MNCLTLRVYLLVRSNPPLRSPVLPCQLVHPMLQGHQVFLPHLMQPEVQFYRITTRNVMSETAEL